MTDYPNAKVLTSIKLTVEEKRGLDEASNKTGLGKARIISLALRDWLASRDRPIPLGGYAPRKIIPGDVKEPMLILVVPREQLEGNGQ